MAFDAVAENLRGVFIPIFRQDFGINNSSIGLMLSFGSLAYIMFTFIGGILCEKLGQKKVFLIGLLCMTVSMFLFSRTDSYYALVINMFLLNTGLSLTGIAINTIVPVLVFSFQAVLMNLTHFCYGLGSTSGQAIAGMLLSKGVAWRSIYFMVSMMFFIILVVFMFVKVPDVHKVKQEKNRGFIEVLKDKLIIFYVLGLGFYVFAEIGTGCWFVNYIQENYKFDNSKSAFYISLFFGVFTIGRLIGGFIVEKFGYINTVLKFLVIALIMYSIGLIIGEKGLVLVSLSGFFFSITFPTIITSVSKVFKENTSYITGIIITLTSTVNMILNLLIGKLNDKIGTYFAFYLIPFSLFISVIFMYLIHINTKKCFSEIGEN